MSIRDRIARLIAGLPQEPQYPTQGATLFVDLERRARRDARDDPALAEDLIDPRARLDVEADAEHAVGGLELARIVILRARDECPEETGGAHEKTETSLHRGSAASHTNLYPADNHLVKASPTERGV